MAWGSTLERHWVGKEPGPHLTILLSPGARAEEESAGAPEDDLFLQGVRQAQQPPPGAGAGRGDRGPGAAG
jgi:hypothetical protein